MGIKGNIFSVKLSCQLLLCLFFSLCLTTPIFSQKLSTAFEGQASLFGSYLPDIDFQLQTGLMYIPELNFDLPIDSTQRLDAELSLNAFANYSILPWETSDLDADVNPYRMWLRYSTNQWEIRAGLQKIDFGSAFALRPLQWFNQIDPRDPLQITNGVYGILGRYYFLDNTNIWVWGLYGNNDPRGLDFLASQDESPEFGGRVQFPVPKGEIAFSYHHRNTNLQPLMIADANSSPEDRFGLDAKWDVGVGLWVESSYSRMNELAGTFRNQFFTTIGMDYTFSVGNGLNVIGEHLFYNIHQNSFVWNDSAHLSALILTYPFGLDDTVSSIMYFNWQSDQLIFFMNYQHQFAQFTGYLMAFYIPEGQGNIQNTNFTVPFSGPGIRIMFVYNH